MKSRLLALAVALALTLTFCAALAPATPAFSDVAPSDWYAQAVAYCAQRGWMGGVSETAFSPGGLMTRSMLAAVLYRQAGSPAAPGADAFADTAEDAWYSPAVRWAAETGALTGYGDGRFGPEDPVTREQLVTVLWRLAGSPPAEAADPFADQSAIAPYARSAVAWATAAGLVSGKDGHRFDPLASATRAEVAAVLARRDQTAQPAPSSSPSPSPSARPSGGSSGGSSGGGSSGGGGGGSAVLPSPSPTPSPSPSPSPTPSPSPSPDSPQEETAVKLEIVIGDAVYPATLADTPAAQAFAQLLPLTLEMEELNGNEKFHYLDRSLPTAAQRYETIQAGDLMLFGPDCVVLFYQTFASGYSYTPLGRVDDPVGLAQALGQGDASVTFRPAEAAPPQSDSRHVLVACFSATGTTRPLAEYAAQALDADFFAITPAEPYTEADLAYYTDSRADREQADPDARPAIAGTVAGMERYDTVLLGYPIWHGQPPRIISTFLERYDFSGKTIVPFCTSHSSPYSDSGLAALAPGARWVTGRRFPGGTSRETIEEWVASLDLEPPAAPAVGQFDLERGTVLLNSGYTMPTNGLGTYSLTGETCVASVKAALERSVRLIDTAYMYGNEAEVGRAIRESGVPREEVFVITKLYPGEQYLHPEQAIQDALDKLDLGYIDLLLLHHPGDHDVEAYHAMERAVEAGTVRSIGLSNWYVEELEAFLPQVTIPPALVQNEIHPYYQENDVIPYIQSKGIVVQGWYPLGGRGHTAELLGDATISAIAQAHGVSSAQVILRWNLQKGVVVIPGSSDPDHILENTQLYHFSLTDQEMAQINALDRGEKHDWY